MKSGAPTKMTSLSRTIHSGISRSLCRVALLGVLTVSAIGPAQAAGPATLSAPTEIRHDRVKPVAFNCSARVVAGARTPAGLDVEALLIAGVQGKAFAHGPQESLTWLESTLTMYGNRQPLSKLRGPTKAAVTRVAMLVNNDYTIAAQMAHGINQLSGTVDPLLGQYIGNLVINLTEPAEDIPEIEATNKLIDRSIALLNREGVSDEVKSFAKWAVRAFAYDDDVAIDTALAGICMSSASERELRVIEKGILQARFDPKRDYSRPAK